MVKKSAADASGDSDELQALFDTIAASSTMQADTPVEPANDGDSDELQSLFDEVSSHFEAPQPAPPVSEAVPVVSTPDVKTGGENDNYVVAFRKLGQVTRLVHNTLSELGMDTAFNDDSIRDAAAAIPDARQRLNYIAQLTEQAASRVLNAVDIAQPREDRIGADAHALKARWDKLYAHELSVDEFRALSDETREFLGKTVDDSKVVSAQLLEIMMAQDFQDLTGQVIKKVISMAQAMESELLQALIEVAPAELKTANSGLMNGPVINSSGRDDVVTNQEQVDDLLESLGF